MYRSRSLPLASLLLFQAAAFEWPICDAAPSTYETTLFLALPSGVPFSPPARYLNGAATLSSVITTTSATPKDMHRRVGVIVGACLGAAGGVLLIGLVLFWILLRHRQHTATAQVEEVTPRSWVPSDFLRGHGAVVVANHPSLSLDLAGADADNASIVLTSEGTGESKLWNRSTDVLDISVENVPRSPLPSSPSPIQEPIEPDLPVQVAHCPPVLHIHTDVRGETSPPGSQEGTPAGSSRSIRPLPTPPTATPPTRPQLRRPRSTKVEEARRSRLSRAGHSADDLRAYVHGDRRSSAPPPGVTCETVGCEIVQHHDGGTNARIDLPPPYDECLRVQASFPP